MIKAIKNFFSRNIFAIPYVIIPSVDKHKLLAEVWNDSSVRTDVIKWYDAKEIDNHLQHFTRGYLVDYFGDAVVARVSGGGFWYAGYAKSSTYEDKPMDPQPTMFALLPKLNGD